MKKLITLLSFFIVTLSQAQVYDARPMSELMDNIKKAEFTYKERGLTFGFNSIQSCLFVSEDILIFKNYCFPARKYPARGYTIITREAGIVELYEEKMEGYPLIKEFRIQEFPVFMTPYLRDSLPTYSLSDLDGIMRELYPRHNPGCWSTSFSKYTEAADFNCSQGVQNVLGGEAWGKETQTIVNDDATWFEVMKTIEAKLVK